MIDQYVTDNLPTIKASSEAWPTMPVEAYVGLSDEVVRTEQKRRRSASHSSMRCSTEEIRYLSSTLMLPCQFGDIARHRRRISSGALP
jgi:hypothetical protein